MAFALPLAFAFALALHGAGRLWVWVLLALALLRCMSWMLALRCSVPLLALGLDLPSRSESGHHRAKGGSNEDSHDRTPGACITHDRSRQGIKGGFIHGLDLLGS